jgi:Ca2+-binding RTX toxin-like protein
MTLTVSTSQTISGDLAPATGNAIEYGADSVTLTIGAGFGIRSQDQIAIFSASSNALSTLINNGNILSASIWAVEFDGATGSIINNAGHSIIGWSIGIALLGNGATVTNHGTISGLTNVGVHGATISNDVVLNNDGNVYGRFAGVSLNSNTDGGVIHNTGTIRSDFDGVSVVTAAGLTTMIDNGGTISGTLSAIHAIDGAISLNNSGTINGLVQSTTTEQDHITNSGKIIGEVHLGGGNDRFKAVGSGSAGKVFGENGVDHLTGAKASDQFDGGAGADVLTGGGGRDFLTGGADNDRFDFNSLADSVKGSKRDKILDFSHGEHDRIDLSTIDADTHKGGDQAFQFIGAQAFHSHGTTHVYGELRYQSHILSGDVNGDGKADFEIHVNAASLAKVDFIL